ncbi:MAG: hypothetical protein WAQ99_16030 [Pyrinomonadaceae bacterium]
MVRKFPALRFKQLLGRAFKKYPDTVKKKRIYPNTTDKGNIRD